MNRVYCDVCKKELTCNVVLDRLKVKVGGFMAEVFVSKNGNANEGDLCKPCLLKALNIKPKRKYMRTPKAAINQAQKEDGTLKGAATKDMPDISTFRIKTPEPGSDSYSILSLEDISVSAMTLSEGVTQLFMLFGLTWESIENTLDSEGKQNLLAIRKGLGGI